MVVPTFTVEQAEEFAGRARLTNPEGVLIHVGVNDIANGAEPEELAEKIVNLAVRAAEHFRCPAYVSAITPLRHCMQKVRQCNALMKEKSSAHISLTFIENNNITEEELADDRHLRSEGPAGAVTPRDKLVFNFVKATLQTELTVGQVQDTWRDWRAINMRRRGGF